MADQMINALPTKTEPVTGDKVLLSGASEEYLIDYDKLATAILNKLTSKTFTLDQGTKTFVAALNELNSKSEFAYYLNNSINIPENSDMDTYIEPGLYSCNGTSPTTLKNSPFADSFLLKVEYPTGSVSYRSQKFTLYSNGRVAYRYYSVPLQKWSDFYYYYNSEDALAAYIKSDLDYNDLPCGVHYLGAGCKNAPENYCRVLCLYGIQGARLNDAIQVAFSVLNPAIYTRAYNNGSWTKWRKFTGTLVP